MLTIIARAQGSEAVPGEAKVLQRNIDYLTTYLSPGFWMTDLQCTSLTSDDRSANLQQSLIVSVAIMPFLTVILSLLTAIQQCFSLICRKQCTTVDKQRFKNSLYSAIGIGMYLVYPEVLMNLLQATGCFKSLKSELPPGMTDLKEGLLDTKTYRMSMLPDEYCEEEYWSKYGMIVLPGLFIYMVLIPILLIISASKKSHIIYKAGISQSELAQVELEDEEHSS